MISQVDKVRLLRMTVTHDLCEALAGDITPYCDASLVASKHDKEGVGCYQGWVVSVSTGKDAS